MEYSKWARAALNAWQEGLVPLRENYTISDFSALVSFFGLGSNLWSLWLKCCNDLEQPLSRDEVVFNMEDSALHTYPWASLFNPIDPHTAWVLTRGPNLPDTGETMPVFLRRDICMSLQSLGFNSYPTMYGESGTILERWGIYEPGQETTDPVGVTIGTDLQELQLLSGRGPKLLVPILSCQLLQEAWPSWHQASLSVQEILLDMAKECSLHKGGISQVKETFLHFAAALWQVMLDQELVYCAHFQVRRLPWWHIFSRRNTTITFHGILVLVGDHQQLWQQIKESYSIEL